MRQYLLSVALVSLTVVNGHAEVSYDQHIKPIFREHCWACHKQGSAKADLALDSYAGILDGGSSGDVVSSGDLDGSRLWQLVSHEDTPVMPPDGVQLGAEKLNRLRKWIEGGLVERPGGARQQQATGLAAMDTLPAANGEPGPVPAAVPLQPVVVSARSGALTSLATSPNAPVLAVASQRQILLFHTTEQHLIGVLPFPNGSPLAMRFSKDGKWLVASGGQAASSGHISIYDVATGDWLSDLGEDSDAWLAVDVSPDRRFVAAGGPTKVVHVIDVTTGASPALLKRHTEWIQAIAYAPDGRHLATGDRNGGIWLWEPPGHLELASCNGHKLAVTQLDWRPDSQVLASASEDGTIRLWSPQDGKPLKSWNAHAGGVLGLHWAPTGQLVSVGRDRKVKVWNADGKLAQELGEQPDIILAGAMSHDGALVASADWQGHLEFWNPEDGSHHSILANPPSLYALHASRQTELREATVQLDRANREMELLATAQQELQVRFEGMLNEAVAVETEDSPSTPEGDARLKQLGELTVERELLERREAEGRAAVAAAESRRVAATAADAEIAEQIARLAAAETRLREAAERADEEVAELESRLVPVTAYQVTLQSVKAAASVASAKSRELQRAPTEAEAIGRAEAEIESLLERTALQIAEIRQQIEQAQLGATQADLRMQLHQLRQPAAPAE
ncbi:MAG: c-type cytochrome domain-containing protein [Planctomycetota bacterium]